MLILSPRQAKPEDAYPLKTMRLHNEMEVR